MSRWNSVATLVRVSTTQNEEGSPIEEFDDTKVFCNLRHIGATEWEACRQAGLHADAQIQVFAREYTGQQIAVVGGVRYDVERVIEIGDYAYVTLAKRLGHEQ